MPPRIQQRDTGAEIIIPTVLVLFSVPLVLGILYILTISLRPRRSSLSESKYLMRFWPQSDRRGWSGRPYPTRSGKSSHPVRPILPGSARRSRYPGAGFWPRPPPTNWLPPWKRSSYERDCFGEPRSRPRWNGFRPQRFRHVRPVRRFNREVDPRTFVQGPRVPNGAYGGGFHSPYADSIGNDEYEMDDSEQQWSHTDSESSWGGYRGHPGQGMGRRDYRSDSPYGDVGYASHHRRGRKFGWDSQSSGRGNSLFGMRRPTGRFGFGF